MEGSNRVFLKSKDMTNTLRGDEMKQRWRSNSMTVLVIREAEQAVKQVRVPKMLVVSVPIAALMSVSGLILSMQLTSQQHIHELEAMLDQQKESLEITVSDKDEVIRRLQDEVVRLAKETKTVQHQVEQMNDLENELEQFVQHHIGKDALQGKASSSAALASFLQEDQDGDTEALFTLAEQSSFNLKRVQQMLTSMEQRAPQMLNLAKEHQKRIVGTPSFWPTKSKRITSSFGYRTDPMTGHAAFHAGLDIGGEIGDPVYAAAEGKVIETGFHYARGNYIIIRHINGLESWYMHLSEAEVTVGESITQGARIGKLGTTGRSTGPHLHFQIVQQGSPIDPYPYLNSTSAKQEPQSLSNRNRS